MTSTENVVQTRQREQWVGTLRVVLISGVIAVHTATAYVTDFAGHYYYYYYYYYYERVTNSVASIAFALPALIGGVFGLGPLFVVAGWFSVRSLARRGPAGFVSSRLRGSGVPLMVFVLLMNALADYLRGRVGGRPTLVTSEIIRAARDMLPSPDASVTAIARLLGVSPGTLYNHIPDLRELGAAGRARHQLPPPTPTDGEPFVGGGLSATGVRR
jgi:hypothetical protein